jgi:hypothetical protein
MGDIKVTSTADRNKDGDKLDVGSAIEGHEPVQLIHSVAANKTRGRQFTGRTGMWKCPLYRSRGNKI